MNRKTFSFWLLSLPLVVGLAVLGLAAETPPPEQAAPVSAGTSNITLSASTVPQRATWQQRFTLGPGDLLNLSLLNLPDTVRTDVPIGPDGRVSFLQARDMPAAGLTIDELRTKIDEALQTYYQNPRTIITPSAYRSKHYFVLGAVVGRGVYPFDRPVSVIEALARAGGLETGLYDLKPVELADLSRSFLVRNGQRLPVDFERLFEQGDLSQNVPLEPNDYLYFASADSNEIYVFGEVMVPGVVAFAPRTTVMAALASRGGFSDAAFRSRVLVIRGSLNHPQTFVVNTAKVLKAKERDFKLQPKDIIYVSSNPWVKAEDLLNTAARAFLQGMLVQWTTAHVGPFITEPLVH